MGELDWDVGKVQMARQSDGRDIFRPRQEKGPSHIACLPRDPVVEPQPIHVDQLVAWVDQLAVSRYTGPVCLPLLHDAADHRLNGWIPALSSSNGIRNGRVEIFPPQ